MSSEPSFFSFLYYISICHCFYVKISCQIVLASSITAATRIHKYSRGISSIHAWINIISVATYHHFYFDSYCTSFSILISSSSSSITKQGMCESHNKLHARFAFFKSHEYRHKKLHLFLLIQNYFSLAMIIQMVNICQLGTIYFLVKFRIVRRP